MLDKDNNIDVVYVEVSEVFGMALYGTMIKEQESCNIMRYTIRGVKTAFHNVIISGFIIIRWTAQGPDSCYLFVCFTSDLVGTCFPH